MEDADDVGSGQDDPEFEGELRGVGAVWQLALVGGSAGFGAEQVTPLLLDAGYFVMDAVCLCADLGGGGDEEAPAGEDPPLDIGQVALAQGEQGFPSRLGRAEGWSDDFGDEAVPGRVDGRQLELFFGALPVSS